MELRKIVYVEFYSPWLSGGYSEKLLCNNNKLFKAVGFVFKETDEEIIIGVGESNGQYLHQVSIPVGLIKGVPIELKHPYNCEHPEN